MKPLPRRFSNLTQRGSIGPQSGVPLPQLMQQLEGLENRLSQLKTGLSNLLQLQQLQDRQASHPGEQQAVGNAIADLQRAVDEFELELAAQTVGWQHVKETFWQIVRFGGLGVVIGWILAWLVIGNS